MKLIRSLLGRRQFLIAFVSSALTLVFGGVEKAFNPLFKTGAADASEKTETGKQKPLKGIVVYQSSGGCTGQIAEALWRGMKSVIKCDVAPIKKVKPEDMAKYDVIAIGSPNWMHRVPGNILVFTHDMPRMDGKHCIIFGTHGMAPLGQFWAMSRNILKKGMTIIGWSDWFGEARTEGNQPHSAFGHPDSIDLAEAEAFGRQMAEYSVRIYAGERDLIPRVPTPEGVPTVMNRAAGPSRLGNLWAPRIGESNTVRFGEPPPDGIPEIDLTKCVYPRCTQCIDNCPVNAIDFSRIAPIDSLATGPTLTPFVLNWGACNKCGGLCEKVCHYDAIYYAGEELPMQVNMTKCTYPKCTECLDNCPQGSIDFSVNPPIFHNWCENCDYICYVVCPENAVEFPTLHAGIMKAIWYRRGERMPGGGEAQAGAPTTGGERGQAQPGAPTTGAPSGAAATRQSNLPKFRSLMPQGVVSKGHILYFTNYPRVVLNKEYWPYHIDEG